MSIKYRCPEAGKHQICTGCTCKPIPHEHSSYATNSEFCFRLNKRIGQCTICNRDKVEFKFKLEEE